MRIASTLLLCLLLSACYRTHYVNFSPQNPIRAAAAAPDEPVRSGWQHFFIWGWVPDEKMIDARQACGGSHNLDSIQTRRTFLEGLVAAVAGYYINVYSPWDGAIYSGSRPDRRSLWHRPPGIRAKAGRKIGGGCVIRDCSALGWLRKHDVSAWLRRGVHGAGSRAADDPG